MEVSSWLEVFSASQCPLSVGLSTPAVCRWKAEILGASVQLQQKQ